MKKWEEPFSHTCGYVKSRVAITLVRTTQRCIRRGQGYGVLHQRDPPPVGRRQGPPTLLVRRRTHPILFNLTPPSFLSPSSRGTPKRREQGTLTVARLLACHGTVLSHWGGDPSPSPPPPGTYKYYKSPNLTPLLNIYIKNKINK